MDQYIANHGILAIGCLLQCLKVWKTEPVRAREAVTQPLGVDERRWEEI